MAVVLPFPGPFRPELEPWVTKAQLAHHLGFTTRWIELRQREGLPSELRGGRRRYRTSAVEAWLQDRYPPPSRN